MKPCEKLVEAHLKQRGHQSVVYEPDGNTPPDFLVDGTIAVEVRRLNQNHFGEDGTEGLEEVAISLGKQVKALLAEMGPPTAGESWFVHYRFSRPVEDWKTLKTKVRNGLQSFMASNPTNHGSIATGNGFEMRVMCRTATPRQSMFVLWGRTDEDSGGFVVELTRRNVDHCVIEKDRKVAPVRSKYKEWWLILVNYIGFDLDQNEKDMVKAAVSTLHGWDKIRIVDPGNPGNSDDL
jgi:hypothetical protein